MFSFYNNSLEQNLFSWCSHIECFGLRHPDLDSLTPGQTDLAVNFIHYDQFKHKMLEIRNLDFIGSIYIF